MNVLCDAGTPCAANDCVGARCTDGTAYDPATCTGAGMCAGALCTDGTACSGTGTCGAKTCNGATCTKGGTCDQSGNCTQGTCAGATCSSGDGTCDTTTGACKGGTSNRPYCNASNKCSNKTSRTCTKVGSSYFPTNCDNYLACTSSGTCSTGSGTCTTNSQCANSCNASSGTCSTNPSQHCDAVGDCTTNNTCSTQGHCTTNATGTAPFNTPCTANSACTVTKHAVTGAGHCAVTNDSCTSTCAANTCVSTNWACNPATGSATCDYWCDSSGSGAPCATQNYCAGNGLAFDCAQECSSGQCYASPHCGTQACTGVSSRLSIAKHTISELIAKTSDVANFGFMSYNQRRFFPYLHTTGATTTTVSKVAYFGNGELHGHHQIGWDKINDRPKARFTQGGVTYTILCSAAGGTTFTPCDSSQGTPGNARYHRGRRDVQHDWCGQNCRFDGHHWEFRGAYYAFTETHTTGGVTSIAYYPTTDTSIGPNWPGPCLDSSWNPVTDCSTAYYRYFQYPSDYYTKVSNTNCGTMTAPVCGTTGGTSDTCDVNDTVGDGRLDSGRLLVPVSTSALDSDQSANVAAIQKWLAPQNSGGVVAAGATPTGCTIGFGGAGSASPDSNHDAYGYFQNLKTVDPLTTGGNNCRSNYVILVTDGEANGPGDTSCGSTSCATNPTSCSCASTKAAYNLYHTLGVKTFVVGFGSDVAGSTSVDNIAKAGGSALKSDGHYAYYAADEDALTAALQNAVYLAVQGDYATTPPTVATSTGQSISGNIGLVTSTEFPSFKGHLRAFDLVNLTSGNPTLLWDAGQLLVNRIGANGVNWNSRRIYTSDANNNLVPFLDSVGNANGVALNALGLGGSAAEASEIAAFSLGQNRDWPLGSMINSTPATHGKGLSLIFPGHGDFYQAHSNRPKMVYVGSDDGMLHAFYLENGTWGAAGAEAWAYVPPALLPVLGSLYANNGEPTAPTEHIYGIASSPKVYDVCSGACATQSDWKTVLIAGMGAGAANYFALDITATPTSPAGYNASPPFSVAWQTADSTRATNYTPRIGQSWSVPAYAFVGSGTTTTISPMGSGYDTNLADANDQGAWFFLPVSATGADSIAAAHLAAPGVTLETDYALLADTGVAIDNDIVTGSGTQKAIAAYQVDLAGRLWRSVGATVAPTLLYTASGTPAQHPFFYSPAILLRDSGTKRVALALADSSFDDPDMNDATAFTPNLTVLIDANGTLENVAITGASGATYTNAVPITDVCLNSCHAKACTGCTKFSASARPIGSPVLLANTYADPTTPQIQALFLVYQPAASSCALGHSYLVVLDLDTSAPDAVQREAKDAGAGKASGLAIGGGGALIVGTSGMGQNPSMITIVAGSASAGAGGTGTYYARTLGIVEKDD
jgi:hypothetical protein